MKISQREARRLKKRVAELEDVERRRLNNWSREWPQGIHLCTLRLQPEHAAVLRTALKLKHFVVVKFDGEVDAMFYASQLTSAV